MTDLTPRGASDLPTAAERRAAFLDGTLDDRERAQMLDLLARSDDECAALVETRALLDELSDNDAPRAAETRERSSHGTHRWRAPYFAIPALAAAAAVAFVAGRSTMATQLAIADVLAPAAAHSARATSAAFTTWPATRGQELAGANSTVAFRLGAQLADFDIAIVAGDMTAAVAIGRSLADAAATIATGAPVAQRILYSVRTSRGSAPPSIGERRDLERELRSLAQANAWFDAGAWSESARIAASSNDLAFFANADVQRERAKVLRELRPLRAAEPRAAQLATRLELFASPVSTTPSARIALLDSLATDGGR